MAATLRSVGKSLRARADSNLAYLLDPRTNSACLNKAALDDEARRQHARDMRDVTASEQLARFADTAEDARAVLDYASTEADNIDAEAETHVARCKAAAQRAEEALLADYLSRSRDVLGLFRQTTGRVEPRMRYAGRPPPDGPNTERLRAADFAAWSAVNAAKQHAWEREAYAAALRGRAANVSYYAENCTCSIEVVQDGEQQ